MLKRQEILGIIRNFGLDFEDVTRQYDTSHGENDQRFHYILDEKYVLKISSASVMREERLQEISRLIARYRDIGVYCPALVPTISGTLSCSFEKEGKEYACFVEEFAIYPLYDENKKYDIREAVEHMGVLAAKYSGVDLIETRSMWSIIDLAPLDVDVDEKQENTDMLVSALREHGHDELAQQVEEHNCMLREKIMTVFEELPRCVYQGDLNDSNLLEKDGHFAGLIDFNLSGTDVNINVFLNETNWFPEDADFERMSIEEMLVRMDDEQAENLSVIFRHYEMNGAERFAFPHYKRIVDLFRFPNVCSMRSWIKDDLKKDKCVELIRSLVNKPL